MAVKVVLSHHTKYRLLERNMDAWKVLAVAKNPSWQQRQENGSIKARKEVDGECIEVVYIQEGNTRVIKTAYPCK
jgi:hypothetical protein